jgi:hypothetical protein
LMVDQFCGCRASGRLNLVVSVGREGGSVQHLRPSRTPQAPNDGSNLSRTTHIGNTILGLVELKRRNITSAKKHLLASARFAGRAHPVQMTFGPSMALANLADRGEHEVVIEYLGLCATFWKKEDGHLEKWIQVLKVGGTPDFGRNTRLVVNEW